MSVLSDNVVTMTPVCDQCQWSTQYPTKNMRFSRLFISLDPKLDTPHHTSWCNTYRNLMIYDPIHTRTAAIWRQTSDNWDVHSRFCILILFKESLN